jgi:hypothetical protein
MVGGTWAATITKMDIESVRVLKGASYPKR